MSHQQPEPWGGEVHVPRWLRRAMRRPEPPGDTPEGAHERRKPQAEPSVLESSSRAAFGSLPEIYGEGRAKRR